MEALKSGNITRAVRIEIVAAVAFLTKSVYLLHITCSNNIIKQHIYYKHLLVCIIMPYFIDFV